MALRLDRSFRERSRQYEELLRSLIGPESCWADLGCGQGGDLEELSNDVGAAIGVDIVPPTTRLSRALFVRADINSLPLAGASTDLVSMRFVVEHLPAGSKVFDEIVRVLRPGGRLLMMTTNLMSPPVALAALLPHGLKSRILSSIFRVSKEEPLPTLHRHNTARRMRHIHPKLALEELRWVQDTNMIRRWVFLLFFAGHLITKLPGLKYLRTNLITVHRRVE